MNNEVIRSRVLRAAGMLAFGSGLLACGGDSQVGTDIIEGERIADAVFTGYDTLMMGRSFVLGVAARDENGAPLEDMNWTYWSGDPTVATVDDTGLVKAVGTGATEVGVRYGAYSASTPVSVVPSLPLEGSWVVQLRYDTCPDGKWEYQRWTLSRNAAYFQYENCRYEDVYSYHAVIRYDSAAGELDYLGQVPVPRNGQVRADSNIVTVRLGPTGRMATRKSRHVSDGVTVAVDAPGIPLCRWPVESSSFFYDNCVFDLSTPDDEATASSIVLRVTGRMPEERIDIVCANFSINGIQRNYVRGSTWATGYIVESSISRDGGWPDGSYTIEITPAVNCGEGRHIVFDPVSTTITHMESELPRTYTWNRPGR